MASRSTHLSDLRRPNDKQKIREHYNAASPLYYELWGEHLHHGYWIKGYETKEAAQIQLVEHLARAAEIRSGQHILDVGCGFGASSIYLAKHLGVEATGVSISEIQVSLANRAARLQKAAAQFLVADAEAMSFDKSFDVVWSVESIAHYHDKRKFFASAANLLKKNGLLAITDWFQRESLSQPERERFIEPIQRAMFVELETMPDYERWIRASGLEIVRTEILNEQCARTWDIALEIIKNRKLWRMATRRGPDFLRFLRGFRAVRAGYRSGTFVYGLIVAKKSALVTTRMSES